MGLDLVELVINVEEAFDIKIPDAEAQQIATPRQLVDYVERRLPTTEQGPCLSQRAFYRLRRGLRSIGAIERDLNPASGLAALLPPHSRKKQWQALGKASELELPPLRRPPVIAVSVALFTLVGSVLAYRALGTVGAVLAFPLLLFVFLLLTMLTRSRFPVPTVGDLSQYLAGRRASSLRTPSEPWTRRQIEETVFGLIREASGLKTVDPDGDFVRDLGMD